MWTQRESSGPSHKRTEGLAPVLGSEFTTKASTLQGAWSKELIVNLLVVVFGQDFARAYGSVCFPGELQRRDHAGLEVEKHRAGHAVPPKGSLAAPGAELISHNWEMVHMHRQPLG